jgi:hypothetical protein
VIALTQVIKGFDMKKNILSRQISTGLLVLMVSSGFCVSAGAADDKTEFSVTTDYFSKYIWRGQNLNDHSVFQPSVSVSRCGFTGSIWGNLDLTNSNGNSGQFSELDYSLDYSAPIPEVNGVSFSIGAIYYDFPSTDSPATTEVYAGLNFDLPLTPYIRLYRDVEDINGSYLQFGIGHTIEKIAEISRTCYCGLQLGSSVGYGSSGYNEGYFDSDSGNMNDWTISIALPVCIDSWTVKPSVNYSTMLSDPVREATDKSDNLWFGVGLSRSF